MTKVSVTSLTQNLTGFTPYVLMLPFSWVNLYEHALYKIYKNIRWNFFSTEQWINKLEQGVHAKHTCNNVKIIWIQGNKVESVLVPKYSIIFSLLFYEQ